jgi:hypothetical protein
VPFETSKGAVPASPFFYPNSIRLVGGKGAGRFMMTETYCGVYRGDKQISIIVDVDDKNCLAELTVALKFNQSR